MRLRDLLINITGGDFHAAEFTAGSGGLGEAADVEFHALFQCGFGLRQQCARDLFPVENLATVVADVCGHVLEDENRAAAFERRTGESRAERAVFADGAVHGLPFRVVKSFFQSAGSGSYGDDDLGIFGQVVRDDNMQGALATETQH